MPRERAVQNPLRVALGVRVCAHRHDDAAGPAGHEVRDQPRQCMSIRDGLRIGDCDACADQLIEEIRRRGAHRIRQRALIGQQAEARTLALHDRVRALRRRIAQMVDGGDDPRQILLAVQLLRERLQPLQQALSEIVRRSERLGVVHALAVEPANIREGSAVVDADEQGHRPRPRRRLLSMAQTIVDGARRAPTRKKRLATFFSRSDPDAAPCSRPAGDYAC